MENAVDFRKLVARQALHPGLIVLPSVARDHSLRLLGAAIVHLASLGDPPSMMVNHVLEGTSRASSRFRRCPVKGMVVLQAA